MSELPRFLICDAHDHPERHFVLHTRFPKFLAEAYENEDGSIDLKPALWLEQGEVIDAGYNARLMRQMGEWYVSELRSYDSD